MKTALTDRGLAVADWEVEEATTVHESNDTPTIQKGHWSFANDLLQFLSWWEPPANPRSLDELVGMVVDALNRAGYEIAEPIVRGALDVLLSDGCIILVGKISYIGFSDLCSIFKLLGSPLRLSLLRRLAKSPATGTELATEMETDQGKMSTNTRALEGAGLLLRTREGRDVVYQTDVQFVRHVAESLLDCISEST